MTTFEPLSHSKHKQVRISSNYTGIPYFNESTFPVLVNELPALQREYPVALFRATDTGELSMHALTAFEEGTNQFIRENKWHAQYIPLFVYCHPFSAALSDDGDATLLINANHPAFQNGTEPLFHSDGTFTRYSYSVMESLQKVREGQLETIAFLNFLETHHLTEPITIAFTSAEGKTVKKNGFVTVRPELFLSLPKEAQEEGLIKGYYAAMVLIEASLYGLRALFDLSQHVKV